VGFIEELFILASCFLNPISKNLVLADLTVKKFAVIQEEIS